LALGKNIVIVQKPQKNLFAKKNCPFQASGAFQ
jgi:hypothetical protein